MWLNLIVTWFAATCIVDCIDIRVPVGGDINFELPGYDECGQYSLLDPELIPVIIIEGRLYPNILPLYTGRSSISILDTGYNLTIGGATEADGGLYQMTSQTKNGLKCQDVAFQVIIQNENFGPWGSWSTCEKDCDPSYSQNRTRTCKLDMGCEDKGGTVQNRTCDLTNHCPRWTEWGEWSDCSAKCGKGFKIRKRVCVNGESALLKSTDCQGPPTQTHLCMTVCEVVSFWDTWAEWNNCSVDCGGGMRNRTRKCVTDSRVTKSGCDGDNDQTEPCNDHLCSSTEVTSTGSPSAADEPLNVAVVVVVLCIASIVLILIPAMLLRKRCTEKKNVDAIAVVRRPEGRRRKPKTSTTVTVSNSLDPDETSSYSVSHLDPNCLQSSSNGAPRTDQSGVTNVYSELSSNFVYPASEFDSVFDDPPTGAMSMHIPQLENIDEIAGEEEHESDENQDEFVDSEGEFERSEPEDAVINNINEAKENAVDDSNDFLYVQPPEDDSNSTDQDISVDHVPSEVDVDTVSDEVSVYYEPPESPGTNSKKVRNVSVRAETLNVVDEKPRKESVYENIANVKRSQDIIENENMDEKTDILNERNTSIDNSNEFKARENSIIIPNEGSLSLAYQKEQEALTDKHIYVNETDSVAVSPDALDCDSEDHIYDVPKFKDL